MTRKILRSLFQLLNLFVNSSISEYSLLQLNTELLLAKSLNKSYLQSSVFVQPFILKTLQTFIHDTHVFLCVVKC